MRDVPLEHRREYLASRDTAINRFTAEFVIDFCFSDGTINWEKLVKFVSEEKKEMQK